MIINMKLEVLQMLTLLSFLNVSVHFDTNFSNSGVVWENSSDVQCNILGKT
jgi:hypothetical protein